MTNEVIATWGDIIATGVFVLVASFGAGMVVSAIAVWWKRVRK